jgi:hypothetical protein
MLTGFRTQRGGVFLVREHYGAAMRRPVNSNWDMSDFGSPPCPSPGFAALSFSAGPMATPGLPHGLQRSPDRFSSNVRAINQASTSPRGDVVYFPSGVYLLSRVLTGGLNGDIMSISLQGDGKAYQA